MHAYIPFAAKLSTPFTGAQSNGRREQRKRRVPNRVYRVFSQTGHCEIINRFASLSANTRPIPKTKFHQQILKLEIRYFFFYGFRDSKSFHKYFVLFANRLCPRSFAGWSVPLLATLGDWDTLDPWRRTWISHVTHRHDGRTSANQTWYPNNTIYDYRANAEPRVIRVSF